MIVVTGAAGFIGFHVATKLLERGDEVVGVDNLNEYYDPALKNARLERLRRYDRFAFEKIDLIDAQAVSDVFASRKPARVINLAAQAGVRYSLEHPEPYVQTNVAGFLSILEACRHNPVEHLVFASTSSVYGANPHQPFAETENTDRPLSLYAATKKANEVMAYSYAHLFRIPCTGLRFFTVYGPWGRPDMALFKFTRGILAGEPIPVFNRGEMVRDFTYIDDIVEGVVRVLDRPPQSDPPFRIFNIGNNRPVPLMDYIAALERALGRKAKLDLLPMQPGDVPSTMADVTQLERETGYRPRTTVDEGVARFVEWYRDFYADSAS